MYGITLRMKAIHKPAPEKIYEHSVQLAKDVLPPTRFIRRRYVSESGRLGVWPRDLRQPAVFGQYINPARDLRKGRRLRAELR